jgi:hypothetical protein
MSTSEWLLRAKDRFDARRLPELRSPGRWIGVDLAGQDGSQHARKLLPLLVLALIAALGISALRIDLIRIRYAMASVVERETDLLEEQRKLIVRRRQLRDPIELAVQARARGFRPPHQIVLLREPTKSSLVPNRIDLEDRIAALPAVAAGPPDDRSRRDWR